MYICNRKKFATLDDAIQYANAYAKKYNVFLGIEFKGK